MTSEAGYQSIDDAGEASRATGAEAWLETSKQALVEEERAWNDLSQTREELCETLNKSGMSKSAARKLMAAVEGKKRLDDDPIAREKWQILAECDPKLAHKWRYASLVYADAADRSFRITAEVNAFFGPEYRIDAEKLAAQGDLRAELVAEATRINPQLDFRFVRELYGEGAALLASGLDATDRVAVAGMYEPYHHLATISLSPRFNPLDTTYHESFHSIEGILTKQERQTLAKAFPQSGHMTPSERTAIAFAEWATKRKRAESPEILKSFRKMALFQGRVGQIMKKHNVEDIFNRIYSGDLTRTRSTGGFTRVSDKDETRVADRLSARRRGFSL